MVSREKKKKKDGRKEGKEKHAFTTDRAVTSTRNQKKTKKNKERTKNQQDKNKYYDVYNSFQRHWNEQSQ